jgi:S1-C subfamily serine protease
MDTAIRGVMRIASIDSPLNPFKPFCRDDDSSSCGSAFVFAVSEEGAVYALTAYHVVRDSVRLTASFPGLGRKRVNLHVLGVCPEIDVALVKIKPSDWKDVGENAENISKVIFPIEFGDSDTVQCDDSVIVIGFPQGQESSKITKGVISGREDSLIQIDASINPGNSGGCALLESTRKAIGVVVSRQAASEGMSYVVPIRHVRVRISFLFQPGLVRIPSLNCSFSRITSDLLKCVGSPITEYGALLRHHSQETPDTIVFEISVDGEEWWRVGQGGEIHVPWWHEGVTLDCIMPRLNINDSLYMRVFSEGTMKRVEMVLSQSSHTTIRNMYHHVDYESYAGIIVMPLVAEHFEYDHKRVKRYEYFRYRTIAVPPPLLITYIVPGSRASVLKTLEVGDQIVAVNNVYVETVEDYRNALQDESPWLKIKTGDGMITCIQRPEADSDSLLARDTYHVPLSRLVTLKT